MYAPRHATPHVRNHRPTGTLTAAALFSIAVPAAAEAAANPTPKPPTNTTTTTTLSAVATGYQLDAAHDGLLSGGSEVPGAPQKWSRDLGGNVSYPVIVGNQGFVTVAKTSGSGTVLHALDSATGQDVWTADLGGTYYVGALTYGGGSLFALNYNGVLTAFNPASGAVLWTEQLPGQYEFSAAPTYANCTVYIGGAGSGGTLYAVDGATGNITWRQSVMNGDGSSPAVNASGVLVSYACQQDYAFDPTAGTLIWNHSTACEGGGGSTPTLGGGSVWLSGFLDPQMALNPADGSPSKAKVPNAWTGTPAFDGTHGFFLENGVLTAQDTDHSKPRWTFSGDGNLSSMPIVVNGYVYIASTSGQVWAVDETTGAVAWTGNVGAPVLGDDSMNVDRPLSGLAAGQGLVVVPASTKLVAFGN